MEYKVVIYQEGILGSLLLGGSKVNSVKFTDFLNMHAKKGSVFKLWKKIFVGCYFFSKEWLTL